METIKEFEITHFSEIKVGNRVKRIYGRQTENGFAPTTMCGKGHVDVQIHPASSSYDYCFKCDGRIVKLGVDLEGNFGTRRIQ